MHCNRQSDKATQLCVLSAVWLGVGWNVTACSLAGYCRFSVSSYRVHTHTLLKTSSRCISEYWHFLGIVFRKRFGITSHPTGYASARSSGGCAGLRVVTVKLVSAQLQLNNQLRISLTSSTRTHTDTGTHSHTHTIV